MNHPAKRVAINTGFLYARMAITVFISLYATRLILNALGANDFGIFNLVGGAIAMLTFLNNAMATATQRFMSYAEGEGKIEKQKSIFNVSMVLHIITAILVLIFLEIVGYFLFNGILKIPHERVYAAKMIFHFLVISTFFTIVSVPYDAVINAHENMFLVAILGIIEAVIKLLIAIYITHISSDKLIIYGLLMAVLSVFLLILRQIYCHSKYKEVKINIYKYYNKSLFKEMTHFAGWSLLGCSSSMIGYYGQGIILNVFFGTIVNAAQGVANQISGQLGAFASTMLKALNPLIVKSEGAGNRSMMLKASTMGSKISFFLLVFFYVPVLIEMPYIFKLWLKNIPDYTIIFCRLLLLRNLIEQLYITLGASITAVGNIRSFQIYNSVLFIVPLVITYLLFELHCPPTSLYLVYIVFCILSGVLVIYFAKINCGLLISDYMKDVIIPCSISFLIIISLSLIPVFALSEGILRLSSVVVISTLMLILTIWFIALKKDERTYALQIIYSRKNKLIQFNK